MSSHAESETSKPVAINTRLREQRVHCRTDINKELERQLSEVRSDLKVKSSELNTIRIRHEQGVAEWQRLKQDHADTKTTLTQLQTEYAKSELIIQQKTELLEMYQHEDLLIDDDEDGDATNDVGQTLGRRKLLLRNSIALASKCRKLESSLEQTRNQLDLERDKNQLLAKKNLANQSLFQELASHTKKTASSCMFSALKARDKEVFDLTSSVNLLQQELCKLQSERDDLSTKLSEILSRRNEVKDMRALVESMRGSIIAPDTCRHCKTRQSECINEDNDDDDDDDDDLLDHVVHRSFVLSALQS
jgi:chromosome segregation ATPase